MLQPDPSNKNRIWDAYRMKHWSRVLELGPLDGRDTIHLARHADHLWAIEGREQNAEITREACREAGVLARVQVLVGNIENFGWHWLGEFDCCWCSGVLYHLPNPWDCVAGIGAIAPVVFGWTHLADETNGKKHGYRGRWMPEDANGLPSGLSPRSFWLSPEAMADLWTANGFHFTYLTEPGPHPNGLQAQFLAVKE